MTEAATDPIADPLLPAPVLRTGRVALALTALVLAAHGRCVFHRFLRYDDLEYVTNNPAVRAGLTWRGFKWAWTSFHFSNWHPLTWLSLQLDAALWRDRAGGFHATNLLLHWAGVLLLFLALRRMLGKTTESGWIAALYAVHPLHVESVAWIAERKGILSTAGFMLALFLYGGFVRRSSAVRMLAVTAAMLASLLAKQMIVTFPLLLLLLDWRPLDRLRTPADWRPRLREKWPLFVCLAVFSVMAYYAQYRGGALSTLSEISWPTRVALMLTNDLHYLWQWLWPTKLCIFYSFQNRIDVPHTLLAVVVLSAVTIWCWRTRAGQPWRWLGWSWYLGVLFPVSGIVVIGEQAHSDRYTDLPLIGIYLAFVCELAHWSWTARRLPWLLTPIVLIWTALSIRQQGTWKNEETVFTHALAVSANNYRAQVQLGIYRMDQKRPAEAAELFQQSLAVYPKNPHALSNLGIVRLGLGDVAGALEAHEQAVKLGGGLATVYTNYGVALMKAERHEEAIPVLRRAIDLDDRSAKAYLNLGASYGALQRWKEAETVLREAIRRDPKMASAWFNLGIVFEQDKRTDAAVDAFQRTVQLDPQHRLAWFNLGVIQLRLQQTAAAKASLDLAWELSLNANDVPMLEHLKQLMAP